TPLDPLLHAFLKPEPPPKEIIDFLSSFERLYLFLKEKDENLISKLSSLGLGTVLFPSRSFEDFLSSARWAGEFWLETALQRPVASEDSFLQTKLMFQDS